MIMDVKSLKKQYNARKAEVRRRLNDFEKINPEDYFYELCFCILTPQSDAYKCDECIQVLKDEDFLNNKNLAIQGILKPKTRFYRNKSGYLLAFRAKYPQILGELDKIPENQGKRDFLVRNIKGIGLKEASHFLRNIGYKGLAILDRHILKNLYSLSVINSVPRGITPKKYFEIEKRFLDFSERIGIPMDELDLLFWSIETGKIFK